MAGTRPLTFEITSPATFAGHGSPACVAWVGFVPQSGRTEQGGTYAVGGLHSTFSEFEAAVAQLKSDLDRILEDARRVLPK